ncbi:MAG: lipid-transfer protein [Phenylobacterium sp.]|uniref:thiolase C-terminal domain-containing protein n=1 Tax=Phenylobacterium sp. TaxID=1871053 RepID=UPI001A53647E|nr:beta-ketoacyl synthase N-terminal-like domain-containing protein [Phenylobacterium sp.]MBL8772092.1 lipid-transfer protein [Phenylobacterium sp.]
MTRPSVRIAGVGMTPFATPRQARPYTELAAEAARGALADCGLAYDRVQQVFAGYVYGDSTSGQRAAYEVGLTGVPVVNVNNNCSTGSTALFLARQAVESGEVDCALALGFEQMPAGAIAETFADRPSPLEPFLEVADRRHGASDAPLALRLFGGAGRDYADAYGVAPETFARVAVKARAHAANNPNAVFRDPLTVEAVMASPMMFEPVLTRLQCCPPTCGAAAAVVVSDAFVRRHGLSDAVRLRAQAMTTDRADSFAGDMTAAVGMGLTRRAADAVYAAAGVEPADIPVVELHDCFTVNEVLSYEALGLAPAGGAERLIADGGNTYGGRHVVNPSGGLLAKGHPLGATGLAQCYELVQQLRGRAGARQVEGARLALQHNLGLGGACVVTLYEGGVPA